VTSISAIDHYSDYKKFMSEAHRILKPGGIIIIWSHVDKPKVLQEARRWQ
jgi:ubiquinone/menaquinone biosynthesis C-methylase UbiE